jgi:hypothetical protein
MLRLNLPSGASPNHDIEDLLRSHWLISELLAIERYVDQAEQFPENEQRGQAAHASSI